MRKRIKLSEMAEQGPKKRWIMNAFAMFTPGHLSPGKLYHAILGPFKQVEIRLVQAD